MRIDSLWIDVFLSSCQADDQLQILSLLMFYYQHSCKQNVGQRYIFYFL